MFDPTPSPRLFGLPPGVDFPQMLYHGLMQRLAGMPPEAIAQVEIYVNTQRMQRRLRAQFDRGGASLLPRIRLVTDLGRNVALADVGPAVSALRRRLELVQFITLLLEKEPDLAPRAAIYDLADSLAALLSEMHDEDVHPEVIQNLTVPDASGHWQRSLKFLQIVERYFGDQRLHAPSEEARQREVITRLVADWAQHPPAHPIIVAGSTGSRGTTALLMRAVARLPQGALVLPGFDFAMPASVWARLSPDQGPGDDHPQYRYARLCHALDTNPDTVQLWADAAPPCAARNALLSLAMRPAPVTDQWRLEGPAFGDVAGATAGISLIEAPSPRHEATAIALALRDAAESGRTAALITPDRGLTRQVSAALARWGLEPDDSAGEPLSQTAPGRLFRHVAALAGRRLTTDALVILLKHPLVAAGSQQRGQHLLWTRDLELWMRRNGPAFPTHADLHRWANRQAGFDGRHDWVDWFAPLICGLEHIGARPLADHLESHISLCEALVAGPGADGDPAELWRQQAGRKAAETITMLRNEAAHGGTLGANDYADLFGAVLSRAEVRDPDLPHPDIMIWGTLEARVQGADLVILAGLNDGIWPALPPPDPWLSRDMRRRTGLLMPEQRVGLSAHDFQQAFGAREIILSRAIRDAEAQTVTSRWLNRWVNLLGGMSIAGKQALDDMRDRGAKWVALAHALDRPAHRMPPATRPSPRPPVDARPRQLSVTRIEKLVRDPYAIYAEYILRLRPIDPPRQSPDAPVRGTILHRIFERFINESKVNPAALNRARFMEIADQVLESDAPWPTARRLWRARLERVIDWFLETEAKRRQIALPAETEAKGALYLPELDFTLTGTADRIDRTAGGEWVIYDYKTGTLPSKDQIKYFNKQLMLEAVMIEHGAFDKVPRGRVFSVGYIGLGAKSDDPSYLLAPGDSDTIAGELRQLIGEYQQRSRGYTSLRATESQRITHDYDHLARFGEWERSDPAQGEDVG